MLMYDMLCLYTSTNICIYFYVYSMQVRFKTKCKSFGQIHTSYCEENGPITCTGPTGPTPLRALRALTDPLRAPYRHSGTYGPPATVQKLTSHEYYRVFSVY